MVDELRSTVDESIHVALRQQAASAHADQLRAREDHEASMSAVLQRAQEVVRERDDKVHPLAPLPAHFATPFAFLESPGPPLQRS